MKKTMLLSAGLLAALTLSGCYSPQDRALGGAAIGGATGAVIGGATTGRVGGAVVGGVIGAVAGGVIGAATAPVQPARCARFGYDYYGNYVCTQYYSY